MTEKKLEFVGQLAGVDLTGYTVEGVSIQSVQKYRTGYWVNLSDGAILQAKYSTAIADLHLPPKRGGAA